MQGNSEPKTKKLGVWQKIEDMMVYSYPILHKADREHRWHIVADVRRVMDEMLECCIEGNHVESPVAVRLESIRKLDVANQKLKSYLQIMHGAHILPLQNWRTWDGKCVEIGRMTGGWMKSLQTGGSKKGIDRK